MTVAELLRQGVVVARIEWRGRARVNAVAFFGVTTLVLFSFAMGPDAVGTSAHAGAFLWLALLLSSVLALSESFRVETDNDALEGLRLLPVDPVSLFLGKAFVNAVLLVGLSAVLLPLAVALYGIEFKEGPLSVIGVAALGSFGIAAPGTVYAAVTARARAREVLLPILLFPLIVPVLLAAVKATALLVMGDPMGQVASWAKLLVAFDLIYWTLGALLFARVVEE